MTKKITEIIDHLQKELENEQKVSVEEIYSSFERKVYGPFLFLIGLLALSPIGAIPGLGILSGLISLMISVQYFFLKTPWLPHKIRTLEVSGEKTRKGLAKSRPYVQKIETYVKPRLKILTEFPVNYVTMAMVIIVSLSMIVLSVIPWGMTLPALALMLIGLGIITHDGVIMLIGQIISAATLISAYLLF